MSKVTISGGRTAKNIQYNTSLPFGWVLNAQPPKRDGYSQNSEKDSDIWPEKRCQRSEMSYGIVELTSMCRNQPMRL